MRSADKDERIDEMKSRPESDAIGMILSRQGVVRATSRSEEPVRGMTLDVDRQWLAAILREAGSRPGVFVVRAWANEGSQVVGDDIMKVLVAGGIRDDVLSALQRLVSAIKNDVVR